LGTLQSGHWSGGDPLPLRALDTVAPGVQLAVGQVRVEVVQPLVRSETKGSVPHLESPRERGLARPLEPAGEWRLARRVLELGCDVVLDWGLWARSERDTYRTEARALGACVVLCLLDTPLPELRRRLRTRNAELSAGTFVISSEELEGAAAFFQRPTDDELSLFDPA